MSGDELSREGICLVEAFCVALVVGVFVHVFVVVGMHHVDTTGTGITVIIAKARM
jgi:hypothetical protein